MKSPNKNSHHCLFIFLGYHPFLTLSSCLKSSCIPHNSEKPKTPINTAIITLSMNKDSTMKKIPQ